MAVDSSASPCGPRANPSRIVEWLEVREIRVQVGRNGQRAHELRLWTTLLDPRTAPALELARVYASRWEHELLLSRNQTAAAPDRALAEPHRGNRRARDRRDRVGQCHHRQRTRPRGHRADSGPPRELWPDAERRPRHVAGFRARSTTSSTDQQKTRVIRRGRALMRRSLTRATTAAHLSARRPPARHALAATPEARIDRSTVAASNRMTRGHRISERHWV